MIVRKMNSCSDPKNPECSNYIDTDADPEARRSVAGERTGNSMGGAPARRKRTPPQDIDEAPQNPYNLNPYPIGSQESKDYQQAGKDWTPP